MWLTIITNGLQLLLIGFLGQVVNTHPELTHRHRGAFLWGFMGASFVVFCFAIYGAHRQDQDTKDLIGTATGGDTYAYLMLYEFDVDGEISAKQTTVIKMVKFPLYNLSLGIADMDKSGATAWNEYSQEIQEIDAPAIMLPINWKLSPSSIGVSSSLRGIRNGTKIFN